jgi:hypothetical protein
MISLKTVLCYISKSITSQLQSSNAKKKVQKVNKWMKKHFFVCLHHLHVLAKENASKAFFEGTFAGKFELEGIMIKSFE